LLSFRQRSSDSVTEYYAAFCDLISDIHALAEFLHPGDPCYCIDESLQVSKIVQGLCHPVRAEVDRLFVRNPDWTLDDLFREAKLEEMHAQRKPKPRNQVPALNALNTGAKRCFFCKGAREANDCPKIAAKKAAGLWVDKPKPTKQ
jgi:hypothetical protein